jgi:tetrahydromethanopterin S-methyltransferase subunit F
MTTSERTVFMRGVGAGTITGLAIGLILALFIMLKPEFFAGIR